MAPTRRTLRDVLAQKAELARIGDARTRQLVVAWVAAWDEVADEVDAIVDAMVRDAASGAARVSSANRLRLARRALGVVSRRLDLLLHAAGVDVSADAARLIRLALTDQPDLVASQLPPRADVTLLRVDEQQVAQMVTRSTEQITARHLALNQAATTAMRRELVRSLAVGSSPREAARRMVARVKGEFDGGLTRALVIARTEQVDAYRTAATAWQDTNADVLAGWQWVCSLSERTCPSCIAHHGERHPLSEPGPLDHQQGRCARMPVTRTWAELGFKGIPEPVPAIRPGDGERWFKAQPEGVQRQVMGPRRYEAWKAGDYPVERWSVRRETPDWRPSYGVGPIGP